MVIELCAGSLTYIQASNLRIWSQLWAYGTSRSVHEAMMGNAWSVVRCLAAHYVDGDIVSSTKGNAG